MEDQAEHAVKTGKVNLALLNHATLNMLEHLTEENPEVDLLRHLEEAHRRYRTACEPATKHEKWLAPVSSDPYVPQKFFLPVDGEITIRYPLAPILANLLCEQSPRTNSKEQDGGSATISRNALIAMIEHGEWLHHLYTKAVVRIAPEIVVKICKTDGTTELTCLQHIRAHDPSRKIPTPEPLGMLQVKRLFYIFSSFVPGITLENIWTTILPTQKQKIQQQLNRIFFEVRHLPLPSKEGFLGAGGDLPFCQDKRRWTRKSAVCIRDEGEFNDFLVSESFASAALVRLVRSSLPATHEIVMTHSDLYPRNVIVDNERNVEITGIIDWENGGAYPDYWEYVKALRMGFGAASDDWHEYLPKEAIGTFVDEYVREHMIDRLVG